MIRQLHSAIVQEFYLVGEVKCTCANQRPNRRDFWRLSSQLKKPEIAFAHIKYFNLENK